MRDDWSLTYPKWGFYLQIPYAKPLGSPRVSVLRDFNKTLRDFPLKAFELISDDLLSVTPPFFTPSLGEPALICRK